MTKFELKKQAIAGTLESSDLQITIDKNEGKGIEINLQSSVEFQYGRQIKKVITETLNHLGIDSAQLDVVDKGALDCTIKARTIAVVHRAAEVSENYDWEELDSWNV